MFKKKIIYLNQDETKYCIVKLYKHKNDMQEAYKKFRPSDKKHFIVEGAHCAYEMLVQTKGRFRLLPETGTIFLHFNMCGAGIIAHELAHAVFWAYQHRRNKPQFPIVINNIDEEEKVLHNLTYAIIQFYKWYWKIQKQFL